MGRVEQAFSLVEFTLHQRAEGPVDANVPLVKRPMQLFDCVRGGSDRFICCTHMAQVKQISQSPRQAVQRQLPVTRILGQLRQFNGDGQALVECIGLQERIMTSIQRKGQRGAARVGQYPALGTDDRQQK